MAKKENQYFSISQISCYRGCRQEWDYKYKQKLCAKAPTRALYVGSTIHKLLELRAKGENWTNYLHTEIQKKFDEMPSTHQDLLGIDFIDCCDKIMRQYDWCYNGENIRYLATEVKIDSKIKGYKRFVGIVDAICEIDGKQYIMEHKTFKSTKMSLDQTWINQQASLYIKVLNEQGYNIQGVIWDMIKSFPYEPPRLLKNGSFGKQYSQQTLMSFYDLGYTDETIPADIFMDIKDNHLNYLDRYITPVIPEVVESVWTDFVETVTEITKNKGKAKNIRRDCGWCEYQDLCRAELTGGDVDAIKQLCYTTPEQREKEMFEKFMQTEECSSCRKEFSIDDNTVLQMCMTNCPKYKKYKETKND